MATYTENYSLVKPGYGDQADIDVLNRLMTDKVDALLFENRRISADEYDQTETYAVGDYAIYENVLYKCLEDTTGNFDPSKWEMTNLAKEVSTKGGAEVTKTASGNPITFDDGADAPLVKCDVNITGSQDLHGYDKPWVGGAGRNKFDTLYRTGYKLDPDTGAMTTSSNQDVGRIVCKDNTAYTLSLKDTTGYSNSRRIVMCFYDSNNAPISETVTSILYVASQNPNPSCTIQPMTGAEYLYFSSYYVSTEIQVEEGTTATSYEPYSNICPITAYTEGEIEVGGKNRFDPSLVQNNKSINVSGVITDTLGFGAYGPYRVKSGTDVTFGFVSTNDSTTTRIHGYDSFGNWVEQIDSLLTTTEGQKSLTVIIPQNVVFVKVSTRNTFTNMQLETGSTATTYEPYTSTTHTTTYPSAIYRGSEDVVNGEVRTEWVKETFDGTLHGTYTLISSGRLNIDIDVNYKHDAGLKGRSISSQYEELGQTYNNSEFDALESDKDGVYNLGADNIYKTIRIRDSRFTDLTTAISILAQTPLEVAFQLATSTTSSVTSTNLPVKSLNGYNHIESSTGDMEVEYITQDFQPLVDLIEESGGGGDSHTYSTTEQVVGKWIDGSDVYEKSYQFTLASVSSYSVQTLDTIANINNMWIKEGYGIGTYNNAKFSSVIGLYNSNPTETDVAGYLDYSNNELKFEYRCGEYMHGGTAYLTIRYTKVASTRSLNLTKSAVEEIPDEIKNAPFEEKPDVNEADDDAPTEVDER